MTEQNSSLRGAMPKSSARSATARTRSSETISSAMHVPALANLVRDAADLQRMGARVAVGDEAADPGDANQNALVAQFAQRTVGRHARHAEGFHDLVLGRHPRIDVPHLPESMFSRICRFTLR